MSLVTFGACHPVKVNSAFTYRRMDTKESQLEFVFEFTGLRLPRKTFSERDAESIVHILGRTKRSISFRSIKGCMQDVLLGYPRRWGQTIEYSACVEGQVIGAHKVTTWRTAKSDSGTRANTTRI